MSSVGVQLQTADNENAYPRPYFRIGDILESTNPNNPADDGYIGTWELYGKGRVTVCIDTSDSNFNTVNKEVGESENTLTVDKIPAHGHGEQQYFSNAGIVRAIGDGTKPNTNTGGSKIPNSTTFSISTNYTVYTEDTGGGKAHNNIQKSIVVYRWRRIA